MDFATVTTQFVANTKARASEVNTNFSNITSAISGGKDASVKSLATGVLSTSSAGYTMTDDDGGSLVLIATGASDRTVILPTVADNTGRIITIKKTDATSGNLIIAGEGAENINSYNTRVLESGGDLLQLQSDGTEWHILNVVFEPKGVSLASTNFPAESAAGWAEVTPSERCPVNGPGKYRVRFQGCMNMVNAGGDQAIGYIAWKLYLVTAAADIGNTRRSWVLYNSKSSESTYTDTNVEYDIEVSAADNVTLYGIENATATTGAVKNSASTEDSFINVQLVG